MHIDTANQVTVARKPALLAAPNPAFGFVLMSTSGTLARCSSFGASEAQDAGLFRFVGEIINVFAIFPQGHALMVVSAIIAIAHAVRITNEERSHLVLYTEVNHLARGFVPHVTDTPFRTSADLVLGTLQFLPPTRILRAVGLLLGEFTEAHGALSLETANATPRDDHGLAGVRGNSSQVDFAQINGCLVRACSICGLRDLDAHVQFKAVIPDEATRPTVGRQLQGKDVLVPWARPPARFRGSPPEQASERDRSVWSATGISCASGGVFGEVHVSRGYWQEMHEPPSAPTGYARQTCSW